MLHFPTSKRSIIFIFTEFLCGLGEESLLLLFDQQASSWRCRMDTNLEAHSSFWRMQRMPFLAQTLLQLEHHFKPWGVCIREKILL